ncbi:MAG TPA: type II secretion system F family protein [Rhodobacteraceae bacterium]|nr:type II secretion system F family protein [Paracoccaceae bacterium]
MSIEPLIYAVIFAAVLFLIEGIYLAVFGKSVRLESRVNRRLQLLEKGKSRESVMETLRKEREQHTKTLRLPVIGILSKKAAIANIAFTPNALLAVVLLLITIAFVALTFATSANLTMRIIVSITMGYGAVYVWLSSKAKKRMDLFEEQLPDAIELMVRSLRVGHPFASSVNIVAQEMPDPLGTEFGILVDEANFGAEISDSLRKMTERVDVQDLRFLAVAVAIQSQSGGNLAEVLDGLGKVIRSRFKLFRRVNAITAEAKWSGWFLSFFPIGAMVAINVLQPNYFDGVENTPIFLPMVGIVMVFLVVNIIFMHMMVNFKV